MKIKEGIATTTTVIAAVASNLNIPEDRVRNVYYSLMAYIKYLVDFTDATNISIPHVGKLHLKLNSIPLLRKKLNLSKNNKVVIKENMELREKMLDEKERILYEHIAEFRKSGKYILRNRHAQRDKLKNRYFTEGRSLKFIQKKQNEDKE